jgi:peptidoglycan/xylan/chitin deacetylase (PgdA/CDA1 family)
MYRRRRAAALLVAVGGTVVLGLALLGSGKAHRPKPLYAAVPPIPHALKQMTPPTTPGTSRSRVVLHGPPRRVVALTFDDGFCARCTASILRTLRATGAHATIFPNGVYGPTSWNRQAGLVRELLARHQVTVGNHTFLHHDPRAESQALFKRDLQRNEAWIESTFHTTARPFFRPPYGSYDRTTVAVARGLGYTKIVLWSGTLAESTPRSASYVLKALGHWARPGAIILAHANHPATARVLRSLLRLLRRRHLRTESLSEMLGRR